MKKSSRVISTLLLGATLTTFSTGVFAVESQKVVKEKLAGATRYETNLAVSAKWEKAETVILVEGYAIPDALAATPLAKQKDAPILLTETAKLTKATADEITRLGAKNAIIVGGEGVVSKEVEKDLEAMNVKVTRLAGQSRFETSEAVVKEMGEVSKVAVVNGYGESDALSIAAPAAKDGMAIVLAGKDELKGSADVVKNAKEKYVIGGEGVVSEKLQKEIGAERLGGATRNETNAAILDKFYSEKEIENLYVAKDGNPKTTELVDALGVGPLAGKEGNPVMLAGAKASAGQLEYLKDKTAKKVTEVGNGINATTLADIVKALEVKDVTPEPSDKAEVTGVEVLNANQIKINFNQKVDIDSAETIKDHYEVKTDEHNTDLLNIKNYTNKDTGVGAKAEVQEDGKTVILTLPQAYTTEFKHNQETVKVKVENIMTANKSEVIEKYENKKVKLFDNTLPELKAVKQVGPKEFDLVFSEPVTSDSPSTIVSAIRIDNGKYTCTAKTRIDNDVQAKKIDANVIRIKTGSEVKDGEHTLTIKENKLSDYTGLKLEETSTKFEAKKNTEDVTASVYKTSENTVTLQFNKEVENAETEGKDKNTNVSYYLDYENNTGYKAEKAIMEDGKLVLSFNRDIPSGDHKILVVYGNDKKDKVQDLWENELKTKEIAFTVAKDTVAPTATVSYNKSDKVIEVKYSKLVDEDDAIITSNYRLKDDKGNYKNIKSVDKKEGNNLVYRIKTDGELSGKYTLTIKGNKIHDTSVERNVLAESIFELDTLDSKAPSIISIRYGGEKDTNKIYIEFSEAMKTEGEGSILDKTLYHLEYEQDTKTDKIVNKTLDEIEDAHIDLRGNNAVIITVPDTIVEKGEETLKVKVGRVCDENNNFAPISGIISSGKEGSKFVKSDKNAFLAINDNKIEVLSGAQLDENDILNKTNNANVNIVDSKKIEFYVKGEITSIVPESIKLGDNQCVDGDTNVVNLKVAEGEYVKATKITLKFENNIKKEVTTLKSIKDEALTTILNTKSLAGNIESLKLNVAESEKKVVKYVDDSATIFVDNNKVATKVVFKLNTEVHNVNVDTFKIGDGDYKVDSVEYANKEAGKDGSDTVILKLDKESVCNAADKNVDIDVELANPIYDLNNNKTEKMDSFQIDRIVNEDKFTAVNNADTKENMKIALEAMNISLDPKVEGKTSTDVAEKVLAIKNDKEFVTVLDVENAVVKGIEQVKADAEKEAAVAAA
ncbi:cell wall-binding repeat-containing protein, partial [Clostridium ihumii]|uniref:cell wall-binding repeat-containing protein n=1 Tax=Clostridium ihumii TaxID=1470356 RepID=UPI0006849068